MTIHSLIIIVTTIGVSLWFFIIASRAGRGINNAESYYAGDKSLNAGDYKVTYFATNVTFTAVLLILAEIGYKNGWWALSVPVAWVLGMLGVRWIFLHRLLPTMEMHDLPKTLHEYCFRRIGSLGLRRALAGATILAFVGTIAAETIGLIYAFSRFGVITPSLIPILLFVVLMSLIFYARKSGFPGIVATDKLQAGFLGLCYLGLIIIGMQLLFKTPATLQTGHSLASPLLSDGLLLVLGAIILFVPFHLCVSDMWQRCYAVQWKPSTVKEIASPKMLCFFGFAFLVPIAIGIITAKLGIIGGSNGYILLDVIYAGINAFPQPFMIGMTIIIFSGFIAGALSTADTLLVNIGYIYQYDWIMRTDLESSKEGLKKTKEIVLVLGIFSLLLVIPEYLSVKVNLVDIAYAVFSNQIAFTPILLLAIFKRSDSTRDRPRILIVFLVSSVILCITSAFAGAYLENDIFTNGAPIIGIITSSIGVIIFMLRKEKRK